MKKNQPNFIIPASRKSFSHIYQLYKWLRSINREGDFDKATEDPDYLDTLLAEYNNAQAAARS